jgi:UDP:flavonoid glycosyltransferase YjiC (YdhE family)
MDYKASSSEILEAVREAVNGKYRNKTKQMKKLASEMNGPERLRKILEDIAYQRI